MVLQDISSPTIKELVRSGGAFFAEFFEVQEDIPAVYGIRAGVVIAHALGVP